MVILSFAHYNKSPPSFLIIYIPARIFYLSLVAFNGLLGNMIDDLEKAQNMPTIGSLIFLLTYHINLDGP
jgi:hypothetical protein